MYLARAATETGRRLSRRERRRVARELASRAYADGDYQVSTSPQVDSL